MYDGSGEGVGDLDECARLLDCDVYERVNLANYNGMRVAEINSGKRRNYEIFIVISSIYLSLYTAYM